MRSFTVNASESTQHYQLSVHGLKGIAIGSETTLAVDATQARWVAVRVQLPYDAATPGSHPIHFEIKSLDTSDTITEKSVFVVPR